MKLNRQMRRASTQNGERLMQKPFNEFKDVTVDAMAKFALLKNNSTYRPDRVWLNNHYVVQYFKFNRYYLGELFDKVMVRRNDAKPILSWTDMQRIKNEIFGREVEAIQFFPKESDLVDQANLYWMFIKSTDLKRII